VQSGDQWMAELEAVRSSWYDESLAHYLAEARMSQWRFQADR